MGKHTFAKTLDLTMELRGFDGAGLSRATGISQPVISRYLSGERIPRGPELVAIAKALRIEPGELLGSDALPEVADRAVSASFRQVERARKAKAQEPAIEPAPEPRRVPQRSAKS